MIFNLQELAMDFRKASIEEFSFQEVEKFLKEVQRVYNNLSLWEQEEAAELWVGFSEGWGFVVDTHHYDNFTPLTPLSSYFIESKNEALKLYGDLYGECYSHKIFLGDFHNELREMPHPFDEEEFFEKELRKANTKTQYENSFISKVLNLSSIIDDIELPF